MRIAPSTTNAAAPTSNMIEQFDDRFMLRDADGQPVASAAYALQRETGELEYGVTDQRGYTHLLS